MMRDDRRNYEDTLRLKNTLTTTTASSAKDCTDQKSYVVSRFDGNKSISKLTEDLKVESLARSGWDAILHITTAKGKVLNILEHSVVITEK